MSPNRQQLKAIQKLLQRSDDRVPAAEVWRRIVEEWGIGRIVGREYLIDGTGRDALRARCQSLLGIDPITASLDGDRIELAGRSANEKLSNQSVFAGLAQVARASPIIMRQGAAMTPPDTLLSAVLADIDVEGVNRVVVIENGAAIRHWSRVEWPQELGDSLFVYRGHGQNATEVITWLGSLPNATEKLAFFDWDPAGVSMAGSPVFDGCLVPDFGEDPVRARDRLRDLQKMEEFAAQRQFAEARRGVIVAEAAALLDQVIDQQWSLTQEAIIAARIPLRVLRYSRGKTTNEA